MARAEAKAHLAAPSGSQYQETLRLGLDKVGGQLIRWLRKRLPAGSPQISDLAYPVGAGFSNETILFRMRWNEGRAQRERDLVLRIAPGEFWSDPLEVIHPLCWSEDHFGWMERWQGSTTSRKRSSPSCARLMC